MAKKTSTEKAYLVFNRKQIHFEVPDDFPEDKIPKFFNFKDFESWYKQQDFKPYKVFDYENKDYVVERPCFSWGNCNFNQVENFFKDLENNHHLIEGDGFPEAIALSIYPESFIFWLQSTVLPMEVYEKLKDKLLNKYPKKSFTKIIQENRDVLDLSKISEQFLEFLFKEKIDLSSFHFFELDFSYPSSFEEKEKWDVNDAPPFSAKKTELLLTMCSKKIEAEHIDPIKNKLKKIIETNQLEKLKVILKNAELPETLIQNLIKEYPDILAKYQSLLLIHLK